MRPSCSIVFLIAITAILLIYGTSYLVLTLNGQYEFVRFDETLLAKRHEWAPRGFVLRGEWNGWVKFFFAPLHSLDQVYWHPPSSEADKFEPMPKPVKLIFDGADPDR